MTTETRLPVHNIHHVAIICSDYQRSKRFYTEILGFTVLAEVYRAERDSYKLDLAINDHSRIELFSFPNPPARVSRPEAAGLRHIAFSVADIRHTHHYLTEKGIVCEAVRIDEFTGKSFFFIADPDDLPIEFYEI
ncbi:MAG: VOC family protein [Spirosomataceae bacterium]